MLNNLQVSFRKILRKLKSVLDLATACILNEQTLLLLLLIGSFWSIGALYACFILHDSHYCQWAFWHLFDLSEIRRTMENGTLISKIIGGALFIFTWILGCGVLISILVDKRLERIRKLQNGLNRYSFLSLKNHAVFLGWDPNAVTVMRELLEFNNYCEYKKCVYCPSDFRPVSKILVLSEKGAREIKHELQDAIGSLDELPIEIIVYNGIYDSPSELKWLGLNHAEHLFLLGELWEKAHDTRVLLLLAKLKYILSKRKQPLDCHIRIASYGLYCQLIREKNTDRHPAIYVTFFNFYENWSKRLWSMLPTHTTNSYPPLRYHPKSKDPIHLLVIGFAQMGQALALEATRIGHYGDRCELYITVVDPNIDLLKACFQKEFPNIDRIPDVHLAFAPAMNMFSPAFFDLLREITSRKNQLTVAICFSSPDDVLSCALSIREIVGTKVPILIRQDIAKANIDQERQLISSLYEWNNIFIFGLQDGAGYGAWRREFSARKAYEQKIDQLDSSYQDPARWNEMNEFGRWKYRYRLDALSEMLSSVGIELLDVCGSLMRNYEFHFTEIELNLLKEASHNRWWAERIIDDRGVNALTNPRPPHINMCPYADLPQEAREIDHRLVCEIPDRLKDIGYQMVRRKGQ